MNLPILSETLTSLGEIVIAYTLIKVHHRVMQEHQIDERVFKIMRKEQVVAGVGIGLIVVGYVIFVINEFV